jgi:Lrp/AsnC family leucine-responsive transcriptional regulator
MESLAIDATDREILGILRQAGRLSWQDLGRRIHLSATATAERVRRLERAGVITGYAAVIDAGVLGRGLAVVIDVHLSSTTDAGAFVAAALADPAVEELHHVTGRFDFIVRAACQDTADLHRLLALFKAAGAMDTETRLLLRGYRP